MIEPIEHKQAGGRLAGKVALVTGSAGGIGLATARIFAQEGATVVGADRAIPASPDETFSSIMLDVADEQAWNDAVAEIERRYGRIDVLVNNAGITGTGMPVHEEALADWDYALRVNLTSVMLGMRRVIPLMLSNGRGSIINTSSIWGNVAVPAAASYHAAKGGIRTLTKHAALAYAARGIRVNSVHPGIVETPMTSGMSERNAATIAGTPMGRMGQPSELAAGYLFLASGESSFMTGAELVIDGGYTAQ